MYTRQYAVTCLTVFDGLYQTVIVLAGCGTVQSGALNATLSTSTDTTPPLALNRLPPLLYHAEPSVNARPVCAPLVSGTVTFHQPSHAWTIFALPVEFGLVYTRQYAVTCFAVPDGLKYTVIGCFPTASTVTWMLAVCPPAVALMVAVPAFRPAVTTPVPITFATELSELVHVTFRSVALSGLTVAVSCALAPDFRLSLPLDTPSPEIETEETGTVVSQVIAARVAVEPSHFTMPPL